MEKYIVKEFASDIVEQSKGRISMIDAEALAIVYIAKRKFFYPTECIKHVIQNKIDK